MPAVIATVSFVAQSLLVVAAHSDCRCFEFRLLLVMGCRHDSMIAAISFAAQIAAYCRDAHSDGRCVGIATII